MSYQKRTYQSNFQVEVYVPEGMIHAINLRDPKADKYLPVAWALIQSEGTENAVIWDILVRENFRGRGYGKEIINELQKRYERLETHPAEGLINSAGIRLCMACGFELKKKLFRRKPGLLVWKK